MIFEKLILKNWISYKDVSHIEFSTNKNKKITLIRGVNKGGKTSILRALKWVLYEFTGDVNQFKKPFELLNREAKRNGEYKLQVTLHIKKDNDKIEITRSLQPRTGVSHPNNNDFEHFLGIKKNGSTITQDNEKYIKALLPSEIHSFFLFDGEKLQDYNDLVLQTDSSTDLKGQIEKVIQTPYLKSAASDLKGISHKLAGKLKEKVTDKQQKKLYEKQHDLAKLKESKENDRTGVETHIKNEKEDLKKVLSDLNAYGDSIEELNERTTKETRNKDLTNNMIPNLQDDIKNHTKGAWRKAISILVRGRRKDLSSQLKTIRKEETETFSKKTLTSFLERSLKDNTCYICDEELTTKKKQSFEKRLKELKNSKYIDHKTEADNLEKLLTLHNSGDNFDVLNKKAEELELYLEEKLNNKIEIENLDQKVKHIDNKEVKELEKQKDAIDKEIRILNSDLQKLNNDLNGPNAYDPSGAYGAEGIITALNTVDGMINEIEKNQPKKNEEQRVKQASNRMAAVIDKVVERLILNVKQDIEKHANHINKKMSIGESSRSLKINNNYGLRVLDKNNEEIATSSMGNQIIALSLLHGLKEATGKQGPLVVDTPLARADEDHSISVLNAYTLMSDQVILLVTGKEVPKDSLYEKAIADQVGKWYEINRIQDEESEIIEI